MIFKAERRDVLKYLKRIDASVNGRKRAKPLYACVSFSSLGPDRVVAWCGDVQAYIHADVMESGGFVFDIKKCIAIVATFSGNDISFWVEGSRLTFAAGDQKFRVDTGVSSVGLETFRKEQFSAAKKTERRVRFLNDAVLRSLRGCCDVAYVDDQGRMCTGARFLKFVNVDGTAMVQLATRDHEAVLVPPEKIGRVFPRETESPLARRLL